MFAVLRPSMPTAQFFLAVPGVASLIPLARTDRPNGLDPIQQTALFDGIASDAAFKCSIAIKEVDAADPRAF